MSTCVFSVTNLLSECVTIAPLEARVDIADVLECVCVCVLVCERE